MCPESSRRPRADISRSSTMPGLLSLEKQGRPRYFSARVSACSAAIDELVLVSSRPPIRAKKARYFEDERFASRILPVPAPTIPSAGTSSDRS
jgi:type IV secretory pathway TraG/TraD family ATPase VirD4